jgi:hypothetical protein
MIRNKKILYSINVQDVQTVAQEKLGRKLTDAEIAPVEDTLGDYIDWHGVIEYAIEDCIQAVA